MLSTFLVAKDLALYSEIKIPNSGEKGSLIQTSTFLSAVRRFVSGRASGSKTSAPNS